MKMVYDVKDRPPFGKLLVFSLQQLLAIMTATLVVPVITNSEIKDAAAALGQEPIYMSPAAALLGAGVGTFVYLLFTKFKSPVFLGSSFAFLGSMASAFAGAATVQLGYLGLIIGAVLAGLVYVVIALAVKIVGVNWLNKLMPPVVIGPTVAIIGLSLAGNAVGDLQTGGLKKDVVEKVLNEADEIEKVVKQVSVCSPYVAIIIGIFTLAVVMICSNYGKKMPKLIPFVIGILSGYALASVFTVVGNITDVDELKVIDFSTISSVFSPVSVKSFVDLPDFTFVEAYGAFGELSGSYIATIAVAYVPVAFVVFAEHVADHKNLSSIIEKDLLEEPGLHRTLLGDGVGSMAGAFFGGCPNTTYGESVGCVAITKNASVFSIIGAAALAIIVAFFTPFVAFVNSIPSCVMGGVCMALYGFIAVSGLKMIQDVDLGKNKNLFVVSTILIAGIGGLSVSFASGKVVITEVACALILGILANVLLSGKSTDEE